MGNLEESISLGRTKHRYLGNPLIKEFTSDWDRKWIKTYYKLSQDLLQSLKINVSTIYNHFVCRVSYFITQDRKMQSEK